jgi:hypothetical protein
MPTLTRRRSTDTHRETWHVYYGDLRVGTIGERAGVPVDVDQWGWSCGFYPGLEPGQHQDGSAETFELARTAFEDAWERLMPKIPDGAFEQYQRSRAFHRWKECMWKQGMPLPTQMASGRSQCYCGAKIDCQTVGPHITAEHMS